MEWRLIWERFREHKAGLWGLWAVLAIALIAIFAPAIGAALGLDPYAQDILLRYAPPGNGHPLGTDEAGRDFLIRLIYGAQVSVGVAVLSTVASMIVGVIIGAIAGYYGGLWDAFLMRFTDALLSLPLLPVLILLAAMDFAKLPGLGLFFADGDASLTKMVLIFVLFSWMTVARLVRGQILQLKEMECVTAARSLGMRDARIILRHVLPSVLPAVIVAVSLAVGQTILFESALSFLGLGIQPPLASWGNMLNNGLETLSAAPMLVFLPGFCILVVVVAFNFIGDGLQHALDPKSVKR